MKKSDYRKFIIKSVPQNDDFASMKEVVGRRYRRLQEEKKPIPDLVLIDGGMGQLHAAAAALEEMGIINQPLASIAKREEILYVLGRENEPVVLDHHSPALHLIQQIRDEAHRFAVTFHRARRAKREITTELLQIPGVGERTASKLLTQFGSFSKLRKVSLEELAQVVKQSQAKRVFEYLAVFLPTLTLSGEAGRAGAYRLRKNASQRRGMRSNGGFFSAHERAQFSSRGQCPISVNLRVRWAAEEHVPAGIRCEALECGSLLPL